MAQRVVLSRAEPCPLCPDNSDLDSPRAGCRCGRRLRAAHRMSAEQMRVQPDAGNHVPYLKSASLISYTLCALSYRTPYVEG
jgi:hypothetical protein